MSHAKLYIFFGISYIHNIVQPSPVTSSRAISTLWKEISYSLSSYSPLLLPPSPWKPLVCAFCLYEFIYFKCFIYMELCDFLCLAFFI